MDRAVIDIENSYQVSVFLDASDLGPSSDVVSALLDMFKDRGLLPTTFQEIGSQGLSPVPRLRLNSPNNTWNVNFGTRRIDVVKSLKVGRPESLGSLEEFVKESSLYLRRILEHYKKQASRLAMLTSGMLREMSVGELESVYEKMNKALPFYAECPPFEWNTRAAALLEDSIGGKEEEIFIISNVNRVSGTSQTQGNAVIFDKIEVAFDINTSPKNTQVRFCPDSLDEFLKIALQQRSRILDEIVAVIDV